MSEVTEQAAQVEGFHVSGQRRHVFDQKTHAGNAIKGFSDHQSGGTFKNAIDKIGQWHQPVDLGYHRARGLDDPRQVLEKTSG
ncbi:hypothetical protein D3C78_1720890 [compost metagenome]